MISEGEMKKASPFVVLCSLLWFLWIFPILCPSSKAQWHKPYGSCQWEGAQVQRRTYDELPNKVVALYIDDNDELYLFYLEGIRDTITGFVYDYRILNITKEKGAEWSQPEVIETPVPIFGQNRKGNLWMDTRTGIIHILYPTYAGDLYDDTLYYTNSNIPNWEFVKIDSLPGAQNWAQYNSFDMAFDSLGNVHLVWDVDFDSGSQCWCKVMYANNCTGEWVKQQVSPAIWVGGSGIHHSFAVQKSGIAHIVYGEPFYCDWECQAFYTRNDSLNSTNWVTDTVPKPSRPLYGYNIGPIKVDANNRVHLLTGGCIAEDCVWPGLTRQFYYYKQAEDSLWQGPETLPDTTFGSLVWIDQLLIDKDGIPYLTYGFSSGTIYFTDRKEGNWKVPYFLVGWRDAPPPADSLSVDVFGFVLDSEGKGHGAFSGFDISTGWWPDDSLELYYLSSSSSSVDTEEGHKTFRSGLFQNYPNPFNPSTLIPFTVYGSQFIVHSPIHTTLKIYNILGQKVRTLVDEPKRAGNYEVIWDGRDDSGKEVSSGIYFYQLRAGDYKQTRKLVLIR
jgi:hypothetical protein